MIRSIFLFLICVSNIAHSQTFTGDQYYLFPINPGQQNLLAGTMGELRSSHFHAGLDIKTGGQIGLPVHAAADGYVYRIKVSSGGYGNALYINHPNGTTTVYGHLEKFSPLIDAYVLEQQYEKEQFDVDLLPQKEAFKFSKGEVVAYSGNTGSSSGPHLHFEIRDINQRILDPLKFEFPEIKDNMPPFLKSIAFVTLDSKARINGAFGRYEFDVIKVDGKFKARVPLELKGNIGVEVYAYDLMNDVWSRNGISETVLLLDNDTIFREIKTNLSFSKQRNILVHMNYPEYRSSGMKYNKLYIDDGNTNDFYTIPSKSLIISDTSHILSVLMKDSYENIVRFESPINNRRIVNPPEPKIDEFEIFDNYLHFRAPHSGTPNLIKLFFGKASTDLVPYRTDKAEAYYLWDLRKGLPDSINYCGSIKKTGISATIPSGSEQRFSNRDVDLLFRKSSLFDTLFLKFEKSYDSINSYELFQFDHIKDPIKSTVRVTLKAEGDYPYGSQAYAIFGGRLSYQGGIWDGEKLEFYTRELATFTIANDSIAPSIDPRIVNKDHVYFRINDDLSGIKAFRATLNGDFVLMKYEPKKSLIWSEKKDKNIPFTGEFKLEVEDNAGNKTNYNHTF